MKTQHIIRPQDAREYIDFQFNELANTLEQFDYPQMANLVKATHTAFSQTSPQHTPTPDCILLNTTKLSAK